MKVLVWQDYGHTNLYALNDVNFEKIKSNVIRILGYGYDAPDDLNYLKKITNYTKFVDHVREMTYDDEMFEKFEIVEMQL